MSAPPREFASFEVPDRGGSITEQSEADKENTRRFVEQLDAEFAAEDEREAIQRIEAAQENQQSPPVEAYADEPRAKANGHPPTDDGEELPRPKAIDWLGWQGRTPPERGWMQQDWLGPDPHLLAGAGGIGKSLFLQTTATALALGLELLGAPSKPMKVLLWLCEDHEDEIVRRQDALCAYFGVTRESLQDKLIIEPRVGFDNTLFGALEFGKAVFTTEFFRLREQVNDLGIGFCGLDNLGQVFGANENDRHSVTSFVNGMRGVVRGRPFCPFFVGHIARAMGSEFSGSAAWENAVRMRWYMGTRLPDQRPDAQDDEAPQTNVVYLAKRKANYTEKDYRRLRFVNGVLAPESVGLGCRFDQASRDDLAEQILLKAMQRLLQAGLKPTDGPSSPDYLPRQAIAKGFHEGHTKKELTAAMNRLMGTNRLRRVQIGQYSNRNPRFGLQVVQQ